MSSLRLKKFLLKRTENIDAVCKSLVAFYVSHYYSIVLWKYDCFLIKTGKYILAEATYLLWLKLFKVSLLPSMDRLSKTKH